MGSSPTELQLPLVRKRARMTCEWANPGRWGRKDQAKLYTTGTQGILGVGCCRLGYHMYPFIKS